MKSNASLLYSLTLMVSDFLALILAFVAAYVLRVTFGLSFGSHAVANPVTAINYLGAFLSLMPFWLIIFGLLGLYNGSIYEKRFSEAGRLLVGSFVGLLFIISYAYVFDQQIFPAKLVPVYGFALAFLLLLLFRTLARLTRSMLFAYNIGITNLLIVGDTKITHELVESLSSSRISGYRIIGIVGGARHLPTGIKVPVFDTFEAAIDRLGPDDIHGIVQTELYASSDKNNAILTFSQEQHVAYRFVPGNTELFFGNIQVELFRSAIPVVAVHQTALIGWGRVVKRIFDLLLSLLLVVVASPVMLTIALTNKCLGDKKVFFRQTRLTRFNNTFRVFKFRTVKPDYNGLTPEQAFVKMGHPELTKAYRENGDQLPGDPRYGRFGNFLRKTSLDELPQLFNVIKGDLSLVGPRALVPEELDAYAKRHAILSVKSGLTGLAQVSGRRGISFDERRKLDMYYVQNWSFWLDLVILLKTVRVVLAGLGGK